MTLQGVTVSIGSGVGDTDRVMLSQSGAEIGESGGEGGPEVIGQMSWYAGGGERV